MKRAKTRPAVDQLETVFKALADRTRLRILALLGNNEVCVCHIHDSLGLPQPTVSRHLAYLKRAQLVTGSRDGKWMHYSIRRPDDANAAAVFDSTMKMLENDPEMADDRRKLMEYCCSPAAPVMIKGRAREN